MTHRNILKYGLLALVILLIASSVGYHLIEGWPVLESLYMTIITLTTVGFGEVRDLSPLGRVFTMVIIVFGITFITIFLGTSAKFMVEGQIRKVMGRRKLDNEIKNLKKHYIICGYGRIGSVICKDLSEKPIPFVVVEKDPEKVRCLDEAGYLYVNGDSTEEDVLLQAGIEGAWGLAAALPSDADNVYITLTARGLRPDIYILARADEDGAEVKLRRAGADKVISPYHIGGKRMAQAILRPTVVDFLDVAMLGRGEDAELQMEEFSVGPNSTLAAKTLKEAAIRQEFGVIVVAIKREGKDMIFNPLPDLQILSGDILIVIACRKNLAELEKSLG